MVSLVLLVSWGECVCAVVGSRVEWWGSGCLVLEGSLVVEKWCLVSVGVVLEAGTMGVGGGTGAMLVGRGLDGRGLVVVAGLYRWWSFWGVLVLLEGLLCVGRVWCVCGLLALSTATLFDRLTMLPW